MNRETRTKVNEKAVMMAINPLMSDVDIVPRGLDTPGIADGVGVAIVVRRRLAIDEYDENEKSTSCVSRLRYGRGRGGRSNEAH